MLFRRRRVAGAASAATGPWAEENARDLFTYEMLTLRELEQDSMLWQTPTLALTAQAFLLTVALGSGSTTFARLFAAFLGMVVAGLSMQLMAKHRQLESVDRFKLHELEERLGIAPLSDRGWGWQQRRFVLESGRGGEPRDSVFRRGQSYRIWQFGIGLFAVANLVVFVVALVCPEWLADG